MLKNALRSTIVTGAVIAVSAGFTTSASASDLELPELPDVPSVVGEQGTVDTVNPSDLGAGLDSTLGDVTDDVLDVPEEVVDVPGGVVDGGVDNLPAEVGGVQEEATDMTEELAELPENVTGTVDDTQPTPTPRDAIAPNPHQDTIQDACSFALPILWNLPFAAISDAAGTLFGACSEVASQLETVTP